MPELKIFTGNSNPDLVTQVIKNLAIPLGQATVSRFSDQEIFVDLKENVRGTDAFVIQSTCYPTNDNLMELMLISDALLRSSVHRITAVIPYFGYARQDQRVRSTRVAISAKVVADMLSGIGINRLVTVDLHADQIQGFFDIPVDNIYASPVLINDIKQQAWHEDVMVISPDIGGVARARAIAKQLNDADLAIIDKRRPNRNQAKVMHIIGDVKGRNCVLVDDMVDTAGTLCQAAIALKKHGAKQVFAYATHPVLSGKAIDTITASELDQLVVTDTIPLSQHAQACSKIRQLSLAKLLAESISRVYNQQSISELFK